MSILLTVEDIFGIITVMRKLYDVLLLLVVVLIPLLFSRATFEVVRVKITLFELILPWIFSIWLWRNFKSGFKDLSKQPFVLILAVVLFYILGLFLYFKNSFHTACFEKLLLNTLSLALILSLIAEKPRRELLHKALIYPALLVFGFGVFQVFGINIANYGDELIKQSRIFSSLANPNNLALYANMVIFLSIYCYQKKRNFIYLIIIVFGLFNLIFTKSGSGLMSFVFGLLILSFSLKKNIRVLSVTLFAVILFSLIMSVVLLKTESLFYRSYVWSDVYRAIKERPFTGWGLGSFSSIYPYFRNPKLFILLQDHQIEFSHPENYYFNLIIEGGILYLFSFLFMNIALLYYLFKHKRGSSLSFCYCAILGSMLFQNLFSQSFYSFTPYFLYLIIFALAMREVKISSAKRVNIVKLRVPIISLFIALNIVTNYYALRFFISDSCLRKAVYYSQLRKLSRAEPLYKKSIEYNYFNALPHYLLGNLYLEDGNEANLYQALRHYNNVEHMVGNYLQLYAFKALAYSRLGDKEGMNLYFKKMEYSDPYLHRQFKHYIEFKD
ncbi:MAG: O-antigen ligase family protein [Candidatus Kaelpia aquatica]|nr:O-antigen ligase family protein [Candidatus Kaelpia aquatica]